MENLRITQAELNKLYKEVRSNHTVTRLKQTVKLMIQLEITNKGGLDYIAYQLVTMDVVEFIKPKNDYDKTLILDIVKEEIHKLKEVNNEN